MAAARLAAGCRLALSTLTVLPMPVGRVDRAAARVAMGGAPLVGALLGVLVAGAGAGLSRLGAAPLVAAGVGVGVLAAATRGLHLDGLADTADGLGSSGPADRVLAVMRSPEIGPFGVAVLVVVLLVQVAALAQLIEAGRWLAVGLGVAVGRVALTWGCRRGVPPARPDGLGALVAGTVPGWLCLLWTVVAASLAAVAVPAAAAGVGAVLLAVAAAVLLLGRARRRIGGVTGDVLGALCEVAVLVAWVVFALG